MQRRPISKVRRSATLEELILVGSAMNPEVADAGVFGMVPEVADTGVPGSAPPEPRHPVRLQSLSDFSYVLLGVYVPRGATAGAEAPEFQKFRISRLAAHGSVSRRRSPTTC